RAAPRRIFVNKDGLCIEKRKNPIQPKLSKAQPKDRLRRESVLRQYAMLRLARGRSSSARRRQFTWSRRYERFHRARRTAGGGRAGRRIVSGLVHTIRKDRCRIARIG